jgi:hypothetical protein
MLKLVVASLMVLVIAAGCGDDDEATDSVQDVIDKLQTSLHFTGRGMEYWYEAAEGGFETVTGVAYGSLSCKNCHVLAEVSAEGCGSCHTLDGTTVEEVDPSLCGDCHGRQNKEVELGLTDVHRTAGMTCVECHTGDEVHGDGTVRNSIFEGGIKAQCLDCHQEADLDAAHGKLAHYTSSPGEGDFYCDACHVQATVSCYNCHLESEVAGAGKVPYGAMKWKLIVKDAQNGTIRAGNVQTATYEGNAVVALAPFHAHTIYKPSSSELCSECHTNELVDEYTTSGTMTVAEWDGQSLTPFEGTIIVPEDWETSMQWVYLTKDEVGTGGTWSEVTPAEVVKQMLFAEPLDKLPSQW